MQNPFEEIIERLYNIEKLLLEIKNENKQKKAETFITRQEAANMLHISLPTLHKRTLNGQIQGYKTGRRILYKKSEVEQSIRIINFAK